MNTSQSIPCPVCGTSIPFDINRLMRGEKFSCPKCEAKVLLSPESRPQTQDAADKLNKLKKGE